MATTGTILLFHSHTATTPYNFRSACGIDVVIPIEMWAFQQKGLAPGFLEVLVLGLLKGPLALEFRKGYKMTRCKQLIYALRQHRCPGTFRISQWGFILVVAPRHKPTPRSLLSPSIPPDW
jgi:hypothetical protein